MKGSPRFREGTAYIRTKYQPAHIKYPLIAIHSVASVNAYDADNLNVDDRVSCNNTAEENNCGTAVRERVLGKQI